MAAISREWTVSTWIPASASTALSPWFYFCQIIIICDSADHLRQSHLKIIVLVGSQGERHGEWVLQLVKVSDKQRAIITSLLYKWFSGFFEGTDSFLPYFSLLFKHISSMTMSLQEASAWVSF